VAYPPGEGSELWFEPLYKEELALVVGIRHPLARRRRVRMAELHNVRMVLLPSQFLTRKLLDDCFRAGFGPAGGGGAAQFGGARYRADPPDRACGDHHRERRSRRRRTCA
jgi:DNA-binding transcriptional LysR family regulator